MIVRRLNGFGPSAFSDASFEVQDCASEWEQEVWTWTGRLGFCLVPWLRQELSMGVWLWCCQVPLPLTVLIKTDTHQGRERKHCWFCQRSQAESSSWRKKKKAEKPVWEIAQLRLSVSAVLLHPSSFVLHYCPESLPLSLMLGSPRWAGSEGCRTAEDWQFCPYQFWFLGIIRDCITSLLAPAVLVGFCRNWLVRE